MRVSDFWAEGTGVLYGQPVGTTMTLRECVTFLIEESDSTAEVICSTATWGGGDRGRVSARGRVLDELLVPQHHPE